MKKLLSIAALLLAFSPFAQAQNGDGGLSGHPDARNDRSVATSHSGRVMHKTHVMTKSRHHVKSHHPKRHYSKHMQRAVPAR